MMRIVIFVLTFVVLPLPITAQPRGDSGDIVRLKRRKRKFDSARYIVTINSRIRHKKTIEREQTKVEALLDFDKDRYRFVVQGEKRHYLLLVDNSGFYTALNNDSGDFSTDLKSSVNIVAPWIHVYPILLSHGVSLDKKLSVVTKSRDTDPIKLRLKADTLRDGRVRSFSLSSDDPGGKPLFQGRIEYKRERDVFCLASFVSSASHESGTTNQGKMVMFEPNVEVSDSDFAHPKNKSYIVNKLHGVFKKRIDLKESVGLRDLESAIQDIVGQDLNVAFDWESIGEWEPEGSVLGGKSLTLKELLLDNLSSARLDFRLDPQGVVIIHRNDTWKFAHTSKFHPDDYSLAPDKLMLLLYKGAKPDDWSDVGGAAEIRINGDSEVETFHTQSNQIRFLQLLEEFKK